MRKLFAVLILSCALELFAEGPEIKVIPLSVRISRTKMLSDKKELKKITQELKHFVSVSVSQPSSFNHVIENDFIFRLTMAFLGKVENLEVKTIKIDPIQTEGKGQIPIKAFSSIQCNGILTSEIISHDKKLSSMKKIKKIKGVAILEKQSKISIKIKDPLSIKDKKFTNKELQKNGIELQLQNIEHNRLKIALNSKEKPSPVFDFTVTITNRPYPANFFVDTEECFSHAPVDQATSIEESSDGTMRSRTTSFCHGNKFTFDKKQLTKDSALKIEIMIPEKEFKVPFCFKNIPLP